MNHKIIQPKRIKIIDMIACMIAIFTSLLHSNSVSAIQEVNQERQVEKQWHTNLFDIPIQNVKLSLRDIENEEKFSISLTPEMYLLKVKEASSTATATEIIVVVNEMLAYSFNDKATWWMIGLNENIDRGPATSDLTVGRMLLDTAEKRLNEDATISKEDKEKLSSQIKILRAFIDTFDVIFGDEGKKNPEDALFGLSIYLESSDLSLRNAAMFWQAAIQSVIDKENNSRVLALLPLVLKEPSSTEMDTFLYQRLFRCRLLSRSGKHAASLALALHLEEQVSLWLKNEQEIKCSINAVKVVEQEILRTWIESYKAEPEKNANQAKWIIDFLKKIKFDNDPVLLEPMKKAIPIL